MSATETGDGAPAPRPLILTLAFDGASFRLLDDLRRRHFPPARNVVPAHLTLFHALPGAELTHIVRDIAAACGRQRPIAVTFTGPRSLGRGVALAAQAPALIGLRDGLAREWRDWLTPQDSARISPHVTVQNKVSPEAARALLAELTRDFSPFEARGEGLQLWRYLGGPWEPVRRFPFGGR